MNDKTRLASGGPADNIGSVAIRSRACHWRIDQMLARLEKRIKHEMIRLHFHRGNLSQVQRIEFRLRELQTQFSTVGAYKKNLERI